MSIIGIIVFLLVLLGSSGYIGWHVWQLLPLGLVGKWLVVGAMLLCFLTIFANFILDKSPMRVAIAMYEVGNSSIFIGLYLLMFFLVLDLGRLVRLVPK